KGNHCEPILNLRMPFNWLTDIHARGWAVCGGHFVLQAEEITWSDMGAEACLHVQSAYWEGRKSSAGFGGGFQRLRNFDGWLASYAGEWVESNISCFEAVEQAIRPFKATFGIVDPPF